MNILEVLGLAFIILVAANLVSMMWAMKKAMLCEPLTFKTNQEEQYISYHNLTDYD